MSLQAKHHIKAIAGGIIILSGLIASGCSGKKEVLSEKEMVNLIVDLKLAEAYANNNMGGPDISQKREELAKSVLAAHNVTQEQLDSTLGWYGKNLDKYAELYEKVDKRMLAKRKKLMKDDAARVEELSGDNLWPYAKNGIISPLGNNDGWVISINDPGINQGERIMWTVHMKDQSIPLSGVLGVEYEDGTSEANSTFFTNRQKIELTLQVDTGRIVKRLYGSMRLKTNEIQPVFADSISILKLPYDSLEFSKYRAQKRYGYPIRVTQEDRRRKLVADSLREDSIRKARDLRRDSLLNGLRRSSNTESEKPKLPSTSQQVPASSKPSKKTIQQPEKPELAKPDPNVTPPKKNIRKSR